MTPADPPTPPPKPPSPATPPASPAGGTPATLSLCDGDLSLATDLYQLTMAAAYHAAAEESGEPLPRATFELWVRRLPPHRRFLVFAGLEQALASLQALRFHRGQIDYLRRLPPFRGVAASFFDRLAAFRFRGDVRAMPEGTAFFPDEPVLAVDGDLVEAQLVETLLLSIVNFQTAIASKAARLRLAADLAPGAAAGEDGAARARPEPGSGARIAEFGSRRAHGPQAAVWAARAARVGGVDSTSNVAAGFHAGIPVVGTMAHSFIMAHEREVDAFRRYQSTFPGHTILLVDTYDTLEGVRCALDSGGPFDGIRLDSGDLDALSRAARRMLDDGGRSDATIFASGDMNEHKIATLRRAGAPIDAYGVGTQLATSADAPYLNGIYKLVEISRGGRTRETFKASAGKVTYPGPKQVVRETARHGDTEVMVGDRLVRRRDEDGFPPAQRLLVPVMRAGELVAPPPDAAAARSRCLAELARLPADLTSLADDGEPYPVVVDPGLEELLAERRQQVLG